MIRTAKKVIVLLCWILIFAGMSGCLSGGAQEERISVAFQVVAFDKAPQKLQDIIEEHKKEEIKMTWEGDEADTSSGDTASSRPADTASVPMPWSLWATGCM